MFQKNIFAWSKATNRSACPQNYAHKMMKADHQKMMKADHKMMISRCLCKQSPLRWVNRPAKCLPRLFPILANHRACSHVYVYIHVYIYMYVDKCSLVGNFIFLLYFIVYYIYFYFVFYTENDCVRIEKKFRSTRSYFQ